MKYLHYKQTLFLYQKIMEASGGTVGLRDEGLLRSALARPKMTFGGQDLYPTLFDKVAVLGESLIKNHPFVDGNKRLAFEAMDIILKMNGYKLTASEDEMYNFTLAIATNKMGKKDIAKWLERYSKFHRNLESSERSERPIPSQ